MKKAKRKSVPNENEKNEQLVGETEKCEEMPKNEVRKELAKAGFETNEKEKTPQEIEIERLLAKGREYEKHTS